jgi:hypothetical protein
MDFASIAGMALTALTPYLVKGGEEIAQGMGKNLWEFIKKPFVKDRDKALVEKLEKDPGDEETRGAVKYKLSEFLEDNPGFAKELDDLLKRMPAPSEQKTNIQTVSGTDNKAIQDVKDSTITINK